MPKDQRVPGDARPQHVLVEQRSLLAVARVVEAGSVRRKIDAHVTRRRQLILKRLAGLHIDNVDAGLVRSAHLHRIGQQCAIAGNILNVDRGVRIPAQRGWVDQALVLACSTGFGRAAAHVD